MVQLSPVCFYRFSWNINFYNAEKSHLTVSCAIDHLTTVFSGTHPNSISEKTCVQYSVMKVKCHFIFLFVCVYLDYKLVCILSNFMSVALLYFLLYAFLQLDHSTRCSTF